MSNEFDRYPPALAQPSVLKFVAGVQAHARAADSVDHTGGIAWRGSPAARMLCMQLLSLVGQADRGRARRLRDIK